MLTFRHVTAEDAPFLYEVYASTRAQELAPLDWSEVQKQAFLRMQFDAQSRDYRQRFADAAFQIIVHDGSPIGRLYVDRRPDAIHVIDIALLPRRRAQGIGTSILRDLQSEAAAACKRVTIYVERHNPARRLYGRLGFSQIEEAGLHLLMAWSPRENGALS